MGSVKNLVGQQFGRLTPLKQKGWYRTKNGSRFAKWLCQCNCGNTVVVLSLRLVSGSVQSCGCLKQEMVGDSASQKAQLGLVSEKMAGIRCAEQGFEVYEPVCGMGKVDLRVDAGGGWRKVQVKSTRHYRFNRAVVGIRSKKYPPGVIDFFVIHEPNQKRFYVIPQADVPACDTLALTPHYDQYIEAWHLLKEPLPGEKRRRKAA